MRFKPRKQPEPAPTPEHATTLPPKVAEALDKAMLHERAEGEGHHRVAVQIPGQKAFLYEGEDEAAAYLRARLALDLEQSREAAKRLDSRIRGMIRSARRERRAASSWVHNWH